MDSLEEARVKLVFQQAVYNVNKFEEGSQVDKRESDKLKLFWIMTWTLHTIKCQ